MEEIQLTDDQLKASKIFTEFLLDKEAKYMVIQGSAGSGKSTLVRFLLDSVESRMKLYSILLGTNKKEKDSNFKIELTATTNKAASVLSELSGVNCSTIYSKLGLIPKPNYSTGEVDFTTGRKSMSLYNTLLIIDEASFMDTSLFNHIDNLTYNCKIILVGDQYQLAPVKQTVPIMNSISCVKASLDQVTRHNRIIAETGAKFKETVKTRIFTPIECNGTDIIHVDGRTFQQMITDEFTHPEYNESKARVLAWVNATVTKYNEYIRNARGYTPLFEMGDVLTTNRPIVDGIRVVAHTDASVSIVCVHGEDILQEIPGRWVSIENGGQLYFLPDEPIKAHNLFKSIKRKANKENNWREYFQMHNQWLDLRPAFASTVHKSQGSTYDSVYINLSDIGKCPIASDVARMMYVAITRASKRVILYGSLPPKYTGARYEHPI